MRSGELVAGRYRLDDHIDGGGMGDVWRGHDTRLDRTVAIKLLHSGLSGNERFRTRFHHEARSVAALQAPGIVSLYDYGEDDTSDGSVSYLIMELVKGRSLAKILRERGRLSPGETLRITASAAEALHAAHNAGIVHRDIKPANMLVDDDGNVKLVDFGIARAKGEAGLTETGMVMGTVAYSAPEQLHDTDLTGAADIYSLGIVAYECLDGQPPFASENPGAVITGHLHQQPPPLPNDVPEPVVQIVERALAKNPANRWRSAAELAQVCRDVASGNATTALLGAPPPPAPTQPMAATRPAPPPPPRPLPPEPDDFDDDRDKRSKAPLILAVVVLLLGVGVILAVLQPWGSDDADDAAEQNSPEPSEPADDDDEDDADEGDDAGQDDGDQGGGQDPGDDDQPEEPTDPDTAQIPDVDGVEVNEAYGILANEGFTNINMEWDGTGGDDPNVCTVYDQVPSAGHEAGFDDEITLRALGGPDRDDCDYYGP